MAAETNKAAKDNRKLRITSPCYWHAFKSTLSGFLPEMEPSRRLKLHLMHIAYHFCIFQIVAPPPYFARKPSISGEAF